MKFIISIITTIITTFCIVIGGFLFLGALLKCDHEEIGTLFSFQSENSTAYNYYQSYCKECKERFHTTMFKGTPDNRSYLDVLKGQCDNTEIIGGQYYTITATVTLGDYDISKTKIRCKVENEDIVVGFSVEFKEKFEELVSSIEEGDVITFHGKYYNEGCGFKDCELINGEYTTSSSVNNDGIG